MWNNKDELEKSLTTNIEKQEFQSWVREIHSYTNAISYLQSVFPNILKSYMKEQEQKLRDLRNKCVEKAMEINVQCAGVQEPPSFSQ